MPCQTWTYKIKRQPSKREINQAKYQPWHYVNIIWTFLFHIITSNKFTKTSSVTIAAYGIILQYWQNLGFKLKIVNDQSSRRKTADPKKTHVDISWLNQNILYPWMPHCIKKRFKHYVIPFKFPLFTSWETNVVADSYKSGGQSF